MSTRENLEYQKNLRFIRETADSKAKLGSPALKLAKVQQDSDLTKPVLTLGDKHNKVAQHKELKSANEVPKTRETSRVADPVKAGEHGDNCLDVNLDDIDYARISEGLLGGRDNENTECSPSCPGCKYCDPDMPYGGPSSLGGRDVEECSCDPVNCRHGICDDSCVPCEKHNNGTCSFDSSCPKCREEQGGYGEDEYEGQDPHSRYGRSNMYENAISHEDEEEDLDDEFDLETGRLVDRDEEGDDYGVEDTNELPMSRGHLHEATKRQKDARQSLARHKVSLKNKRTKTMKHKSNASLKKESAMTLGDVFLNELSSFNKEVLPGSGDISKQMKEFDDLLLAFSKNALELHKEFTEELKVDMLGGQASPQMAPRIGERNRMLMIRAGILRKLAAACTQALENVRREG